MKTETKQISESNGEPSEEEKAQLLLQKKNKEKQEKFLHEYRLLCQKYSMQLTLQQKLVVERIIV